LANEEMVQCVSQWLMLIALLLVAMATIHGFMLRTTSALNIHGARRGIDERISYSHHITAATRAPGSDGRSARQPKIIARKPAVTVQSKSNDSWKSFIRQLDSSKPDSRFGKQSQGFISQNISNDETQSSKPILKDVNIPSTKDDLKCIHFEDCSGCVLKSDFANAPVMQFAREYFQRQKVPFQIHLGNITEWRTHVKLAVQPRSKWGGLKFGLYRMNSHEVEAIPHCRVQHPILNDAAETIRLAALDAGVKGYLASTAKQDASGELRYIQLSLERSTGKVQVVLVWNSNELQDAITTLPRLIKNMKTRNPNLWHSISVNFNTMSTNNIFDYNPSKWRLLWGLPYMKERICNATFYFKPQIFRQANLNSFEDSIIPFVAKHIPVGSAVSELYAGIGLFGLNVANRASSILCSDSNDYVAEVFDRCASSLPAEESNRVFFECLDAATAITESQCDDADVLLVDPPRRGIHDTVKRFLLNNLEDKPLPKQLKRLIYVGCGFEALARDCSELIESKLWKIHAAEGFAVFPGSNHLEAVVVLDRK
jgi:tRNA/tmRNA/rRNA uracil-C5-methylase (TrmA/RlmC/RlmD family)